MKRSSYYLTFVAVLAVTIVVLLRSSTSDRSYHRQLLGSIFKQNGLSRTHNEVFSTSTSDGAYFTIEFGDQEAFNPNIIPHPTMKDTWIIIAQLRQDTHLFAEIACNAALDNNTMKCINHAAALPIAPTFGEGCTGDLGYMSLNRGPHDARVFYGPRTPYAIFGSNSKFTCFGQWIQDFRTLVEWGYETFDEQDFIQSTELQRPPPYGTMEKNWFLFWDQNDQAYLHYDVAPRRVYAKVEPSGEVGPNMAPLTAEHDDKCMLRYMPKLGPMLESIHQATNSLLITMCSRRDPSCMPDDTNTFIFTIFQHKTYFNYHALYEPYLMVFEQTAPFQLYGISKKPFWIHGRKGWDRIGGTIVGEEVAAESLSDGQKEEMFYVTSMSWKDRAQKYHGYMDDVLFLAVGVEDERTAGIDVKAGDLFRDLGKC